MAILGLGLTLLGCVSSDDIRNEGMMGAASSSPLVYHVGAIEDHERIIAQLEQKIQKLNKRIVAYNQKPYIDTKGFRRSGWKNLIGTWKEDK